MSFEFIQVAEVSDHIHGQISAGGLLVGLVRDVSLGDGEVVGQAVQWLANAGKPDGAHLVEGSA